MRQCDNFKLYFFMKISLNIWHFHLGSKYWLWLKIKERKMGGLGSWGEGRIRRMFQINYKDILPQMRPNTVLPTQKSASSSCSSRQGCYLQCQDQLRSREVIPEVNVRAIYPTLHHLGKRCYCVPARNGARSPSQDPRSDPTSGPVIEIRPDLHNGLGSKYRQSSRSPLGWRPVSQSTV